MKLPKVFHFLHCLRRLQHTPSPDEKKRKLRTQASARYGGMGERELQLRMELILENFIPDQNYEIFDTAKRLSGFSLSGQERFCKAAERLALHSRKLAYCFFLNGIPAIIAMSDEEWDEWLQKIESVMLDEGEAGAIKYLKNLDSHLQTIALPRHAVTFEEVEPIIQHFVTALGGRQLKISKSDEIFTDTEQIFLLENCSMFLDKNKNFEFYKTVAVFLWAQTRFGTWQIDMARLLYESPDFDKAVSLFQILENLRLDACITRELPGIARIIDKLGGQAAMLPRDETWKTIARRLSQPDATAHDSLEFIQNLRQTPLPQATVYQGVFKPTQVIRAVKRRIAKERDELQEKLSDVSEKIRINRNQDSLVLELRSGETDVYQLRLSDDGAEIEITPEIRRLLESIRQDLGKIPEDYLRIEKSIKPEIPQEPKAPAGKTLTTLLPEWDHSIRRYRLDWCKIFIREVSGETPDFVNTTISRYQGSVKQLRRTFEALRNQDALHRHEPYGDEINIDAAISAFIDAQRSEEPEPGVYIKRKKTERDIAAAFVIDMSGSTKGWVNETEKEALVLLCEAMEKTGDRYAIYGFSGHTRECCNIFRIKSFDETYNDEIKSRIGAIKPQEYTRMGAAIRFVHKELLRIEAKTRIMIAISDGRPDDSDGYRGRYGVEDTRRALFESSFHGIHPYCITIDTEAADYLAYMYGRSNFSIVDHVEKLPFQVSDIYRRITT